jgi:ectoine hydroxylase-related dioxygenase (phytanoyl-CoA dioxygenase family)
MTRFDQEGFTVERSVVTCKEQQALLKSLGSVDSAGRRGVLSDATVHSFANSPKVVRLIRDHTSGYAFPVRAIFFDKSPDANWSVTWHQDLTIAVAQRIHLSGFGPWSVKDGVVHVQPPVEVLEQMITVRIHLDPANESNGALKVIPGSHLKGKLSSEQIDSRRNHGNEVLCVAQPGDVLLMRPLILHSSSRSSTDEHRRVLHIEYAACQLPAGLEWKQW